MKNIFTLLCIFFSYYMQGQSFVLSTEPIVGTAAGGCLAACSAYCVPGGSMSHAITNVNGTISVPAGNYVTINITTNNCDVSSGSGLDGSDNVIVNGVSLGPFSNNATLNYSGCFQNATASSRDIIVTLTANRRDETITVSYTFTTTNPGGCLVLPIVLGNFEVFNQDNKSNKIQWSTITEVNNDFFMIERANNNHPFEVIATLKGVGDSKSEINYSYEDTTPNTGLNSYRLKQTDYDGKSSYSYIKSVRNNLQNRLVITPKTTQDRINILTDIENYDIMIYDLSGLELFKSVNNSLDAEINIDHLINGIYYIKVTNGNTAEITKIVKI